MPTILRRSLDDGLGRVVRAVALPRNGAVELVLRQPQRSAVGVLVQRVVDRLQLLVTRMRKVLVVALRLPPEPSPAPPPVG